jgi:hypothetical protein
LRTALSPDAGGPALRAAALKIDADLPWADLKTLAGRIDESLIGRRSLMLLAAIFAGVALVLAGVDLRACSPIRSRNGGARPACAWIPSLFILCSDLRAFAFNCVVPLKRHAGPRSNHPVSDYETALTRVAFTQRTIVRIASTVTLIIQKNGSMI